MALGAGKGMSREVGARLSLDKMTNNSFRMLPKLLMLAEAANIFLNLHLDILLKRIVKGRVGSAQKHEILPNANAQLVAYIVKKWTIHRYHRPRSAPYSCGY
jgi:hypothetical protein